MSDLSTTNIRLYFDNCRCDGNLLRQPETARLQLLRAFRRQNLPVVGSCATGGEKGETVTVILLPDVHILVHTFPRTNRSVVAEFSGQAEALDENLVERIRNILAELFTPEAYLSETGAGPALAERVPEEDADLYLPGSLVVDEVLESCQSLYQYIQVTDTPGFGRVLVLDDVFQTSEKDEFLYHEPLIQVPMIIHPGPRQVLIIGGGDGGSAKEALKHPSVTRCDMVELDGEVVRLSRKYLGKIHQGVFDDRRLNLQIGDGFKFVAETKQKYDVVSLDLTDPDPQSGSLYTPGFFSELQRILSAEGLLTLHLGTINASPQHAREVLAGLREVFPEVRAYFNYVPLYAGLMVFCLAGNQVNPIAADEAQRRIRERGLRDLLFFSGETCRAMFAIPPYIRELLNL